MIIPVIIAVGLYVWFSRETVWWEFIIPFAVSALFCLGAKAIVEKIQTSDTEFWSGWVVNAQYYEDWDETVPCRHPEYATDDKGNTYFVGYAHVFDVDYHAPY